MYTNDLEAMAKEPKVQPEHIAITEQFANEMMERFNPERLNEILHHLRQLFISRRESEIEETQLKLNRLQESLKAL